MRLAERLHARKESVMTTEMSWQDAIRTVLRDVDEPLDYNQITNLIGERSLRKLTGATPASTVSSNLGTLVSQGEVVRTGRGLYALPETAERNRKEEAAEEQASEEKAADPERLTVKAYGLHWDRNIVDWSPVRGQLWGQQNDSARPVDFADQDGIYLLHSWNEIVYVGQTFTRKGEAGLYARLKDHHTDRNNRKSDRWDTFSWFGFKPVAEGGNLLDSPLQGDIASVIDVIESMFIEALMPRLNMQAGRGVRVLRESGLYFQSAFQRASRGFR